MKIKIILVAMLLLVLVCTLFVACNSGEQQIEKKPTAKRDPANAADVLEEQKVAFDDDFDCETLVIMLTNSESLNNLFYDYTVADFEVKGISSIKELYIEKLNNLRRQVKENGTYTIGDASTVNPKTYVRGFEFYIENPTKENAWAIMEQLRQREDIRAAEPKLTGSGMGWFATTNDPELSNQRTIFNKIQLFDAWDSTTGSSDVKVGVIDTGIYKDHPDLTTNLNLNLGLGSTLYDDPYVIVVGQTHGTRVAGIIGAVGNNGVGISGVCQNVTMISLRADGTEYDPKTNMFLEDPECLINAINYATNNNIQILNFSGGFSTGRINTLQIESMRDAIELYPGLLVVAAGNSGLNLDNETLYPHSFKLPNMIVVGASNNSDSRWNSGADSSNFGNNSVDLFAPGAGIYSTYSEISESGEEVISTYKSASGTSMAAPFVTGVAALILAKYPSLSAAEIKGFIINNVDSVSALSNLCVSGGRLNAKKAVEAAHVHNSLTLSYTSRGVRRGHSVSCNRCSYTDVEAHNWSPVKVPKTEIVKYHICTKCLEKTEIIEIPHPSSLLAPNVLALINEKASVTSGDFDIEITKDVAIVKKDGKYYLMIACDDDGKPVADLSRLIRKGEVI